MIFTIPLKIIDIFYIGSRIPPNMSTSVRFYFAYYFYGLRNPVAVGGA